MKILVTGAAGFIGYHLVRRLISEGHEVIGLDNINDYYEQELKFARLAQCGIDKQQIVRGSVIQSSSFRGYSFVRMDLEQQGEIVKLFEKEAFEIVIHLAAQAGVRYSLTCPEAYISSNITGFLHILESCRKYPVRHLVFASSSSVYGLNTRMPFSEHRSADHPVSLYAASKKSNEMMAHVYSHLFGIPVTGLRFFTVYGPWGRPDMALFLFTRAILNGEPIDVYNEGNMARDFTYVDDIVEGIARIKNHPPSGEQEWSSENPDPATSSAPYRIFNIGCNRPVKLMDFIHALENTLGKKAILRLLPMQPGDIPQTWADISSLEKETSYRPMIPVEEGVRRFVEWYREYYKV